MGQTKFKTIIPQDSKDRIIKWHQNNIPIYIRLDKNLTPIKISKTTLEALEGAAKTKEFYQKLPAEITKKIKKFIEQFENIKALTTPKIQPSSIPLIYTNKVEQGLDGRFIKHEQIADIITLGLNSGENVMLYGPPGYGKSEMIETILKDLGYWNDTFIQSFSEGLTPEALYGNYDFAEIEKSGKLIYNTDNSFLNYPIFVAEELMDAPAQTLLSLKDTLTSKHLRNGSQRVPMKTKIVIALTNKEPAELAKKGDAFKAINERFALRMRVAWDDHGYLSYKALFDKAIIAKRLPEEYHITMARFCAKTHEEKGNAISPRSAVKAYGAVYTKLQEIISYNQTVNPDEQIPEINALYALNYIEELESFVKTMIEDFEYNRRSKDDESWLNKLETKIVKIESTLYTNVTDTTWLGNAYRELGGYKGILKTKHITDGQMQWKLELLNKIDALLSLIYNKGLNVQ